MGSTPIISTAQHSTARVFCRKICSIVRRIVLKSNRVFTKIKAHASWPVYSRIKGWQGITTKDYGR
ncbi:MAG: hypothetical protein IJS39_11580, partial [Synergistaceae bacterium]|nr:hypothetical protein [Synergistaceae bacterium]